MLIICEVTLKSAPDVTLWAIKDAVTGNTVSNPYGPGPARYATKQEAVAAFEDAVIIRERESY